MRAIRAPDQSGVFLLALMPFLDVLRKDGFVMNQNSEETQPTVSMPLWGIGATIAAIAILVRLFSNELTMVQMGSTGIEHTFLSSRREALEDIATVFIAFGLSLIFIQVLVTQLNAGGEANAEPGEGGNSEHRGAEERRR